jgi:ferredoxin
MSLKILKTACINCGVCEFACPNQAIEEGPIVYEIHPDRCTECVGHFEEPQCEALCPIEDCIVIDTEHPETHEQLLAKYHQLTHEVKNNKETKE